MHLAQLNTLDLGRKKITNFEEGALKGLKSLTNLYLNGNNLKRIDSSQFTAFQNTLQVLDLQSN